MTEIQTSRKMGRPRGYIADYRPWAKTLVLLEQWRRENQTQEESACFPLKTSNVAVGPWPQGNTGVQC